jgi:uncharacterized iron-regulated membrane protein
MIITGVTLYFKMLAARRRAGKSGLFWADAGTQEDWKRAVHRGLGLVSAAFLAVVAFSGLWLAYESLYFGFYMGSAQQRAEQAAFTAQMAKINPPAPPLQKPDPMSAEAQPGRLAAMKRDIGLTDDELAKVKLITDDSVKQMDALRKAGDPQQMRERTGALHQSEADRIMAVLTPEERPKFQAWRDAQLLGTPVQNGNGGRQGNGQGARNQQGGQQQAAGQQGGPGGAQAAPGQGPGGTNGANRAPGNGAQGRGPGGGPNGGGGGGQGGNANVPLRDAELPSMLRVTLSAMQSAAPNTPIKAVRLRFYAGIPQGVVIAGSNNDTTQLVFNAETGKPMSETEPGYPPVGFPFGWQAHQWAKALHRGSVIGLTGRFMDLFAGLALLYLSINGIALYIDYWKEKRRAKKLIVQRKMENVA